MRVIHTLINSDKSIIYFDITMSFVSNSAMLPLMLQWLHLASLYKTLDSSLSFKTCSIRKAATSMVNFQSSRSDYKKNAAGHLVSAQFYPISSSGSGYKRTVEYLPYVEVVYTHRWHFLRSLQMCQSLTPSRAIQQEIGLILRLQIKENVQTLPRFWNQCC